MQRALYKQPREGERAPGKAWYRSARFFDKKTHISLSLSLSFYPSNLPTIQAEPAAVMERVRCLRRSSRNAPGTPVEIKEKNNRGRDRNYKSQGSIQAQFIVYN